MFTTSLLFKIVRFWKVTLLKYLISFIVLLPRYNSQKEQATEFKYEIKVNDYNTKFTPHDYKILLSCKVNSVLCRRKKDTLPKDKKMEIKISVIFLNLHLNVHKFLFPFHSAFVCIKYLKESGKSPLWHHHNIRVHRIDITLFRIFTRTVSLLEFLRKH